jgi:ABC-type phosphate transport system substrate-binding protein
VRNSNRRGLLLLELTLCFLLIVLMGLACMWTLPKSRLSREQTQWASQAQSVLDNTLVTLAAGSSTTLTGSTTRFGVLYSFSGRVESTTPKRVTATVNWGSPSGIGQSLTAESQGEP